MNLASQQQSTFLKKTIILESINDTTDFHQFYVDVPYNYESRELNLGVALHEILHHHLQIDEQLQIFYNSIESGYFIYAGCYPFKFPLFVGEEFINLPELWIKFRKVSDSSNYPSKEDMGIKKKRVNDRTIQETLKKVALWRQIQKSNPCMTLEEAAKQIDISKKTLDDYHSQIRLAEQYGFDFDNHLDCKMGVLRKFVRERHKKKAEYHFDILDKVFRPFSEEGLSDEEKDYKQQEEEEEEQEQEQQQEQEA